MRECEREVRGSAGDGSVVLVVVEVEEQLRVLLFCPHLPDVVGARGVFGLEAADLALEPFVLFLQLKYPRA